MLIEVIKSKIHRVKVTDADLSYIGSITLDKDLIDAANFVVGEKVQVVNINNGERLETYIIEGKRASGEVTLNGPAARKAQKGDIIIIIGYAQMEFEDAKPDLILIIYAPCYDKSEHSSSEALLRGAFLKSALHAEKKQKEVLAISLENLNFPEAVLEGIVLEISETLKDLSSNWEYLKKLVFINKK